MEPSNAPQHSLTATLPEGRKENDVAQRNQDFWNDDFRRGQDSREWEEGRQDRGEWRAGRGGYEGRGYEGRHDEGRELGRYGREDLGRGSFGSREGLYGEGRLGGYGGMRGSGEGRGTREEFVRGYQGSEGRFDERGDGGRYRMGGHRDDEYGMGRMDGSDYARRDTGPYGREDSERYGGAGRERGFGRFGEVRYGRGGDYGGTGPFTGRSNEDVERGRGRYIGGGFGGMGPEMGRNAREEGYEGQGRGSGESLRSIGYGMARMDVGERRTGRGPKGYMRSDERIREDLCERLMQGWMNAENVDVQVKGGEVTLLGTVDRREEKRAIEDLAESVLGVKEVHNQLRVSRPGERAGTQGTPTMQASENPTTRGLTDTGRTDEDTGTKPSTHTPMHS